MSNMHCVILIINLILAFVSFNFKLVSDEMEAIKRVNLKNRDLHLVSVSNFERVAKESVIFLLDVKMDAFEIYS